MSIGREALRRFAYLLAAQWLRDGLQAVFLLLLARRALETYGDFMLAMNLGQILLFCSEFGINQHFMVQLSRRGTPPSAVIRQITLLKSALLAAAGLVLVGFCLWQGYPPQLLAVALVIGLSFGLDALANTYYVVCQSLGRHDIEGRLRGGAALLGYGFGIAALLCGAPPLVAALFKPLETLVGLYGAVRLLARRWRFATGPIWRSVWEAWRGAQTFTLMALAAILYNKINIFFLQRSGGSAAVAQYSATWQLVDGLCVLASSLLLGKVLFPEFARLWTKDREAFTRMAREYALLLTALALPVMYVLAFASGPIIHLAYGAQYAEAARVQPLLSLCVLFAFVHNLAYYLLISMSSQSLLLGFFTAGLVVNALLCAWLIPAVPLDGAVQAIVATKAFMAVLTVGACQATLRLVSCRGAAASVLAAALAMAMAWGGRQLGADLAGQLLGLAVLLAHLARTWGRRKRAEAPKC